jgi:hypothetical protein
MSLVTVAGKTVAVTSMDGNAVGALPAVGYYRLRFTIKLSLRPQSDRSQVRISHVAGHVNVRTPDGDKRIGRLAPIAGLVSFETTEYVSDTQAEMELELDRERLEQIERLRHGGDITFYVGFRARVAAQGQVAEVDDTLQHTVQQSAWTKILGEIGYKRIMLLEIPVPNEHERPELAQAVKDLVAAQDAMARGHERESVGHLRDTLESIGLALKDGDDISAVAEALFQKSRSMDKATRLRVVRRALKLITHPARHRDEVTVDIEYDRVDAVSLISMVAALMPMAYETHSQAAAEPDKATSSATDSSAPKQSK